VERLGPQELVQNQAVLVVVAGVPDLKDMVEMVLRVRRALIQAFLPLVVAELTTVVQAEAVEARLQPMVLLELLEAQAVVVVVVYSKYRGGSNLRMECNQ
jgi:hypothetical protein